MAKAVKVLVTGGSGKTAPKITLPMQPGDLPDAWADVEALSRDVGHRPRTDLETGVRRFVEWYLEYYHPQPMQRPS